MRKNDIEKSLKRFLKRKVSYSLSLLIAFMITGGISFGAGITAEEIQENKGDLLTKIQTEREEIKRKIAENERLIKEYNSDFVELVRKGDFYSKPLIPSTQVFFSYQHLDNGKMKDRTDKEFKETIDAVNEHYGTISGESLLKSTGNVGKDKVMAGNGVVVDNEVFRETIEVGANIKPVEPELPSINPNVSVNVSAPVVSLGALPGTVSPTMPSISTVTAPVVVPPTAPGNLSVNVSTPSAVDKITVTTPPTPAITAPAEKRIEVSTPTAPGGFEPTTVTAPTAPSIPVIVPPTIPTFASKVVSSGNGTSNAVDQSNLSNGVIEMVAIKSGDFNLKRNTGNTWTYSYSNYSGMNAWAVGSATWDGNTAVANGSSWADGSRTNATSNGSQYGFQKLVGDGNAQSTMLSNATFLYSRGMESSTDNLGEFVHLDVHGAASVDTQRDGLDKATNGLGNKTEILNAYDDAGNINWSGRTSATSNRHTWINSGKLVIEGGNTSVTNNYDHYSNSNAKAIVINTGDIIFQPYFNGTTYYQKYTSAFVMSLDGTGVHHIMYNGPTGSIKTYTQTASIFLSGSSGSGRPLSIVNRGTLEMYGENSAGIYLKTGSNNDLYFTTENFAFDSVTNTVTAGSYKPLKLFGDSSIGLYGEATGGTTIGNLAVDIGEAGKGNQNFTTSTASGTTNGTNLVDYDINSSGSSTNIEKSFGIIANAAMNLTSHQIRIYDKTEDSVGVYPNADIALNIGGGEITLNGGSGNIAVLINGKGSVTSTGNVSVTGGVKNMAVYVKGGTSGPAETVSVDKITATNTEDSVVVYGESGAKITANELNVISKVGANPTTINKKDTGAAFASGTGTIITIDRAATPGTANISIIGSKLDDADRYVGFGVMATNGGVVSARNNYIEVTNGSTAAASIGANSNIDLSGGTVEFDGSGYAVYSDGTGKINLSNSNIILKGKSTAFDLTLGATSPITLDSNSRIHVESNDVVVFNLKNATGLNTNNLEASITTALGAALGGTSLSDLIVAGAGIDKYKTAAVDGGTIIIGNLDKTGTGAAGETQEQKDGNFYYNRFLGQRLVATATNSKISAILNNEQASKFNNQVVGLEMNSSKLATLNTQTGINLVNSTIIADRDEAGAGAIGAYINYGVITVDGTSSIKVEKENNTANDKAAGIYAVNGSKVSNAGEIEVGGKESIGILGMAYRETLDGTVVVAEYGSSAVNQGEIDITNSKNITLDGEGSIGIYAYNNNASGTNTDANVSNTGNITVGNSGDSAAIGIYGKKAKISNTGNITVGNGGVAIYATKESEITNIGTLNLGSNGIGVIIDGTSTIAATVTNIVLNSVGEADTSGKTGIFYKGTGTESRSINIAVNASALDKGTAIYAEDMSVTSSGTLGIGQDGVGIFVKGTAANTGINLGTINLTAGKTGAVGMYTKTANIFNNTGGIINVNDSTQIGMYAESANGKATNTGAINLNVDGATGIYVTNGATAEISGNNITFAKGSSVGVFAENAAVNFKGNLNFVNDNENKNIYVYGKGATVGIDAGKIVTVDGGTPTITGNKTVGIYLETLGTSGSIFTSNITGQLDVVNEAVGIYSKGNNTLNVNVTATGEKTTGVFIEEGSTLTGTVTARGTLGAGAVGVYGSGGAVTIGAGGLTLNTDTDKGTGMYLADGAYASGGKITVKNTAAVENIGVYYSKGTASGSVTNGSEIELTGNKNIGIYAADGINLVNTKNITSTGVDNNIASYAGGNSTLTSNGDITMTGANNIGIYTGKGSGINNGTIDLTGATGTSSGMVAKTDTASDTASVENNNTITVGNNLGMYIAGAGTSSGKNTGSIIASGIGTGVYVDGGGNSFDGTGGSITSNAVGIYLKDTDANKITAGTLNMGLGGVGVFGENAKIDFAVNVAGMGAVGVAAKDNSVISGNITTGEGSVGVYLLDDTVTFNGANITTGTNSSETSVGILFNTTITGTYTMNNVSVNAKNGVGIYLNGSGMTLNHNGTVTTENGIGIYVKNGTSLTTGTSIMNINGGTGVYVDGGIANLGTTGNLTFNFGTGGGIGVYNNGGTLILGNNITATGSGSLAATENGDLNSSGNLNIGEGGAGLLGTYNNGTITPKNITNNGGTISAHTGGIGLAAIKGISDPTGIITINNSGIINADGISNGATPSPSIGVYTDIANVVNTGNINVGNNGIGIYSSHNGVLTSVQNDNMTMTGTDGIGVYLKGATGGLVSNNINSTGSRNTGIVLEGVLSNINVGTVNLGNESVGAMAVGTTSIIDGTISVGASSGTKSAIGIVANGGSNVTVAGTTAITAGNGGIGVYAEGAGTTITVANIGNISVGTDGIYMYSKGAALTFTGDITADNQIGIVADGGSVTANGSSTIMAKNGGIGAYVKNAAPSFTGSNIVVQAGIAETSTDPAKYSVGIYYDGVTTIGIIPVVTQTGSYTTGIVLNNSTGTTAGGISIGGTGTTNQVGVMAKGNSNLTVAGPVTVSGGDNNIGVYGESSAITVNSNISVAAPGTAAPSGDPMKYSSVGVFMNKGLYAGTGNVTVGNNSIGIYGKDLNGGSITQTGTTMTAGDNGVGIYGTGTGTENINLTMTAGITLGNNNSIGVYAKDINSSVTGDMSIGTNTSIGIVSEGTGNVTYTGDMTIAAKTTTGSVGIYKKEGIGTITTLAGNWTVGASGYGIYVQQGTSGKKAVINNNVDMTLGMSSVGIFSNGANIVNNYGNITVGATDVKGDHDKIEDHLNSIGIYATGGTAVSNSGNITVNYDHSVGIYGDGAGTKIQNTGTINVDGGGVGILVRDKAIAINAVGGNIILGSTLAPDPCTATTVGMAAYSGARIENAGTITVNEGIGMLIGQGATFANSGTIYLKNGIGIEGPGAVNNYGNIIIISGGSGTPGANVGLSNAEVGSVKIESNGTITINDKYVSIGGTLSTAGNIVVNGALVDVTTGTPLFNANSVSGEVRILPNFATTGNGISYEIEGFVNTAMGTITGNKLTPVTSPLFIAKVTDNGNLVIAKRPYADITIGEQFDALDKGLDNILKNSGGSGKDADILKGLNEYLEGLPADQFEREASAKLAETRGDIYGTIQGRMQDINRAFDNSFYELESSYNLTKDSSKYSVIYTDGNYKDSTLGIDDYDYKVMGLLYMKEKEGTEYGSKYGYTLGFTGSKFDFDDGGSKEDVYSLRVGAHRVKNLSEERKVSWLSRIELGYNRHIAKRKLNLQETYENKGEYNTYSVAFDNRLTKVIYTDLSRELDVYADLDLEYGKVDDFKESAGSKGGLEVQIKDNDYLSAQAGAGVKASQRIYAGNDISVKVTADVKYAYEFGDNYDGNKARLKNGEEGYYSLITPEEREGKLTGKIGLTVEKANHMGVTFEVEAADEGSRKDSSIKYGMRFNYKF